MTGKLRRHLTINNVLAMFALFIALSAGAYAAGLKKNSVKSKQIKDGAVRTQDIANDALVDQKIADATLGGIDVANDTLTGSEVDEATLKGAHAASASDVSGLQIKSIDFQSPANGTTTTILDFPNHFQLTAKCSSGGDFLNVNAISAANGQKISVVAVFGGLAGFPPNTETDASKYVTSITNSGFDQGDSIPLDTIFPSSAGRQAISIFVESDSGFVAEVDFATDEPLAAGPCKVTGSATGG